MKSLSRRLVTCFSAASTVLATGCATVAEPKIVEKPVCDAACQRTLELDNITRTLSQVRDPKTGGINSTVAGLILRIYRNESTNGRQIIENGLKKQGIEPDAKSACLVEERGDKLNFVCPNP